MSSSGTLCSDWPRLVWWVMTLVSWLLRCRCSFPRTAPGCRCRWRSSAQSCGVTGCWKCFRGECCCSVSVRQCRCRWTPPCWGGQGQGRLDPRGNRRPHVLLQLLRRTSARHCGCWRRYWTGCCCWSDWSTECRPAEDTRTTVREAVKQRRWHMNKWDAVMVSRVWPSSVCLGSLFPGHPVWVVSSAPLHHLAPETMMLGHARGVLDRKHTDTCRIKTNYTKTLYGWQRGLNAYSTFKHCPPAPNSTLKITLSYLDSTEQHTLWINREIMAAIYFVHMATTETSWKHKNYLSLFKMWQQLLNTHTHSTKLELWLI